MIDILIYTGIGLGVLIVWLIISALVQDRARERARVEMEKMYKRNPRIFY